MVILFPIKCRHYLEVADLLESVLFPGSHQLYSNPQFSHASGENRGRKPSAGKGPAVCACGLSRMDVPACARGGVPPCVAAVHGGALHAGDAAGDVVSVSSSLCHRERPGDRGPGDQGPGDQGAR